MPHAVINFLRMLGTWFLPMAATDKKLLVAVLRITGSRPANLKLYKLALKHSSSANQDLNEPGSNHNERLEYLGDAIIGAVVADFLFKKFPFKPEGFLTEIRSRLVNRETMSHYALKIGLNKLIDYNQRVKGQNANRSIYGDAMEAFIGAVYLDKGYYFTYSFIIDKLVGNHIDLDELVSVDQNHKSRLIEWAQKENKSLRFETVESGGDNHAREFLSTIFIDNLPAVSGKGLSKKKAEQMAAGNMLENLKSNEAF
jgi:ribonuclease III